MYYGKEKFIQQPTIYVFMERFLQKQQKLLFILKILLKLKNVVLLVCFQML